MLLVVPYADPAPVPSKGLSDRNELRDLASEGPSALPAFAIGSIEVFGFLLYSSASGSSDCPLPLDLPRDPPRDPTSRRLKFIGIGCYAAR